MTKSAKQRPSHAKKNPPEPNLPRWAVWGVRAGIGLPFLLLYVNTLATVPLWGDPTEYTVVGYVLGIAHPPGYALMAVAQKLWQTIIPFGTVAWRAHLLSAFIGAGLVVALLALVQKVAGYGAGSNKSWLVWVGGVYTAVSIGSSSNFWQHSIHANPHLLTAAFLVLNLCLLTWWGLGEQAYSPARPYLLYIVAFAAGLGVVHHPLTLFAWPAYAIFILWLRPTIWREWRTLLGMMGAGLLGLSLFFYYPWRSSQNPAIGPSSMNTLDGFLDHVLARGLAESLPFFTLAELPLRQITYLSILRVQYLPVTLVLAVLGFVALWRLPKMRPFAALYTLAFLTTYAFVISLRAQDIMAYLLGPNLLVGVWAGLGVWATAVWLSERPGITTPFLNIVLAILLLLPFLALPGNYTRVSLQNYTAANEYKEAVLADFAGQGQAITLLNDWEHFTPLEYARLVENRWPDETDVRPLLVSAAEPWLPSVFNYLPGGQVWLSGYRREIVDAGFRLRARGRYEQVVEPGETSLPEELTPVAAVGAGIEVVGYGVRNTAVAGDFVPLTLALRVPQTTTDYYVPVLQVGQISYPFTTDTHLITPLWQPNEIIIERFDFALPHDLPAGTYPVSLRVQNLSQNADAGILVNLPPLNVQSKTGYQPNTAGLLANYRQKVGLRSATVWQGVRPHSALWGEPISATGGDVLNIFLNWEVLAPPEQSYTVFLHLIDGENRPLLALDYTPLGGSAPTHLWFPKWLPGQNYLDPYRMVIPPELPPGAYFIEVGLYEMTSGRRLHMHDATGNLIGDRLILGQVDVR
jgi:hypothetical protein